MCAWASREFLALCEGLASRGFPVRFASGARVARSWADIGAEEFMLLTEDTMVSLVTGKICPVSKEEHGRFVSVPSIEEMTQALAVRGYRLEGIDFEEQRRWKVSTLREASDERLEFRHREIECCFALALYSALNESKDRGSKGAPRYKMYEGNGCIVLGSGSPRRRELLAACGLEFQIDVPDVDELPLPGESPEAMVGRLAHAKAAAVAGKRTECWVIGADTTVAVGDKILGKPRDIDDAVEMLLSIQGRQHAVWGAFAILNAQKGVSHVEVHRTEVHMSAFSRETALAYARTGEPSDKAGAYAAQGIGAALIDRLTGSYTNVVGLELNAVLKALLSLGAIRLRTGCAEARNGF